MQWCFVCKHPEYDNMLSERDEGDLGLDNDEENIDNDNAL